MGDNKSDSDHSMDDKLPLIENGEAPKENGGLKSGKRYVILFHDPNVSSILIGYKQVNKS